MDENGTTVRTNFPENVNDTFQAYNNAVAALRANAAVGNPKIAALNDAKLKIQAAYEAAALVNSSAPSLPASMPGKVNTNLATLSSTGFTAQQIAAKVALAFWNHANENVTTMLQNTNNLTLENTFELQALVGPNSAPKRQSSHHGHSRPARF